MGDGAPSEAEQGAAPFPSAALPEGQMIFSVSEVVAAICAAVLAGVVIGGILALACVSCRMRFGLAREAPCKAAQPVVTLQPHYNLGKTSPGLAECSSHSPSVGSPRSVPGMVS